MQPPPLGNDCFAMPQGVNWTPVDEALAVLRARLSCVVGTETVVLDQAASRILADPATALRANPPAANSAVDGFGFCHASLTTGVQRLPLVAGRSAAGAAFDGPVPMGKAVRILTGANLPAGVDTVIMQEDTTSDANQIVFHAGLRKGANTRLAGEDVDQGALLLGPGRLLMPQDIALMAATGLAEVRVHRRLRVGVLSTGDEIVQPGSKDAKGRIFDANRPMLLAILKRWGMEAVDLGHVGDDRAALRDHLDAAATQVDAIVTSGGASAGDEDHLSAILNAEGTLHMWRVAMKPGRPLLLGMWNGVPLFGLPGNPVAAFVCTLVFARPALCRLSGAHWADPAGFAVPATFFKAKKAGRREYLRARLNKQNEVEVFPSEGSGRISGLSWSDGLVELPDAAADFRPGTPVRYIPYASFGL